jgi:hypothetical protein
MRPRLIDGLPGLDPNASPFERFRQITQRIVKVSKIEADMEARGMEPRINSEKGRPAKRSQRKLQ